MCEDEPRVSGMAEGGFNQVFVKCVDGSCLR